MGNVVAITFDDPDQATQVRESLRELEKVELLSLDDAAVIVRDEEGKFHVAGEKDRGVRTGAYAGGAIGLLLATMFFPIGGIVLGALAGAGIGAAANLGIDKKFVKDIEAAMPNNSSALIVYARRGDPTAVRAALQPYHGKVFLSTLDAEADEALRRAIEK